MRIIIMLIVALALLGCEGTNSGVSVQGIRIPTSSAAYNLDPVRDSTQTIPGGHQVRMAATYCSSHQGWTWDFPRGIEVDWPEGEDTVYEFCEDRGYTGMEFVQDLPSRPVEVNAYQCPRWQHRYLDNRRIGQPGFNPEVIVRGEPVYLLEKQVKEYRCVSR